MKNDEKISLLAINFGNNLKRFLEDANAAGYKIDVGSGYRTPLQQVGVSPHWMRQAGFSEKDIKKFIADAKGNDVDALRLAKNPYWLKRFRQATVTRNGKTKPLLNYLAMPGNSYHQKGKAADLEFNNNPKAIEWAKQNAKKYNLNFRLENEDWHIEPLDLNKEDKLREDHPLEIAKRKAKEPAQDVTKFDTPVEKRAPSSPPPASNRLSQNVDYPDLTGRPFAEAFEEAREELKSPMFRWKGKLYTTQRADEVASKIKAAVTKEPSLPAKDGGVEDIFGGEIESPAKRASRLELEKEPEDTDIFSSGMEEINRMPSEELGYSPVKKKKSDILQETIGSKYDSMGFGEAFAKARKKGEKEFSWRGKPYTTKYKEEI